MASVCLQVLWADTFAEKPSKGETRWSTPVLEVLLQHLADPADIIAMNFGLWYDPKNPVSACRLARGLFLDIEACCADGDQSGSLLDQKFCRHA